MKGLFSETGTFCQEAIFIHHKEPHRALWINIVYLLLLHQSNLLSGELRQVETFTNIFFKNNNLFFIPIINYYLRTIWLIDWLNVVKIRVFFKLLVFIFYSFITNNILILSFLFFTYELKSIAFSVSFWTSKHTRHLSRNYFDRGLRLCLKKLHILFLNLSLILIKLVFIPTRFL